MRFWGCICALLMWPTVAQAEWLEASSPHFVVYANDSEAGVRGFTDKLERYHSALEQLTRSKTPPVSPSNRLTVYVVKNVAEVQELAKNRDLAAFYIPRAAGSLAVVPPPGSAKATTNSEALTSLLHEYAHHFVISASTYPMPRWFSEGSAEFYSSASFSANGEVELGRYNLRVDDLIWEGRVTARMVLDASGDTGDGVADSAFYAKSWQIYHYLVFEPSRKGQLARYVAEIAAGKSPLDAAWDVFGDLDVLEGELDEYAKRRKVGYFAVLPSGINPGQIDVRTMTAGEVAALPIRLRLNLAPDAAQAQDLLTQARAIAARFPSDAKVLALLAQADFAAEHDREAIAAADAAIAIDPAGADAYVRKGMALFRIARASGAADDYEKARVVFAALSEREPDHPLPLAYAFLGYVAQGKAPPAPVLQGMERAVKLAPFDPALRMNLAMEQVRLGQTAAARANLLPVANDPHGGREMAEAARALLVRLDATPAQKAVDAGDGKADDALAAKTRR